VKETTMSLSFHSIILATVVAATVAVAVGVASAALYVGAGNTVSGKADRLPLGTHAATDYVTVEIREARGSSLNKVPLSR
jgi:hypothetical protein